jgi:EAL domain-containing protein (putative c-di-GMP-specific phosphodiesterase class I)
VNELGERREVDAMVHSLVMLAHNLGMRVIAEGVETQEQMALITEIGCDEAQGYLLGRPTSDPAQFFQPEEALVALVELRRAAGD